MRTSVSCVWGLDVCAILRVSPDLLRGRFLTGKYFEVGRDGWGTLGSCLSTSTVNPLSFSLLNT